jgi:hypothetical protein
MPNEIEAEAVLENCRALIKQIIADLSAEKPFADETSATSVALSSTVMLRDCQTGGENDRLGAGAYRRSRRCLRHRRSVLLTSAVEDTFVRKIDWSEQVLVRRLSPDQIVWDGMGGG